MRVGGASTLGLLLHLGCATTPAPATCPPPPHCASSAPPSHGVVDPPTPTSTDPGMEFMNLPRPVPTSAPVANASSQGAPSRADVANALRSVTASVRACGGRGAEGEVRVIIVFGSDGAVRASTALPPHLGTPVGDCAASAVRGATVPPFARESFSVSYPFALR